MNNEIREGGTHRVVKHEAQEMQQFPFFLSLSWMFLPLADLSAVHSLKSSRLTNGETLQGIDDGIDDSVTFVLSSK